MMVVLSGEVFLLLTTQVKMNIISKRILFGSGEVGPTGSWVSNTNMTTTANYFTAGDVSGNTYVLNFGGNGVLKKIDKDGNILWTLTTYPTSGALYNYCNVHYCAFDDSLIVSTENNYVQWGCFMAEKLNFYRTYT